MGVFDHPLTEADEVRVKGPGDAMTAYGSVERYPSSFVDDEGVTHKLSPLRFGADDIRDVHPAEDASTLISDMMERIERLEALVQRIATHLGIE